MTVQNAYPTHLQSLLTEIQTLQQKVKTMKEENSAMGLEQSGKAQGTLRLQADLTNAMRVISETENPPSLPSIMENLHKSNAQVVYLTDRIHVILSYCK